ncbi:lipopolysaccharide kinase (Kdo/WaaP) family protein [Pseudomonas sp. SJZ080]|uniref:lipopolysaccharide kinase InaA family protein n=1 Tax=Pseudomonas sp. SJZ080 TaxID=2572888 RepID=UPI00119B7D65|nr:lipopolysaccharide kinase InaA family protein [Pseudomonas sp. SJZ080]TWC45533.1 lipopolysaccharide kinase (Kdo/WaaP) family protein [Pseudomonas sp. SJZ080]
MAVQCAANTDVVSQDRFDHFWNQRGEWVEEPNVRRGGESGVQRVKGNDGQLFYAKRQTGHVYRSWLHPFGRPTVLRERDALIGLSRVGVGVPEIVFCGAQRDPVHKWRALLVTKALDGFEEIEHWYAGGGRERHGEAVHDRVLKELADNLVRMHKARWQHSCLYLKHVFVRVTGEGESAKIDVALIDLEKGRQRLTARHAASHDLKQLRRHSSFSTTDWQKLVYLYETAFGSAIKGL